MQSSPEGERIEEGSRSYYRVLSAKSNAPSRFKMSLNRLLGPYVGAPEF